MELDNRTLDEISKIFARLTSERIRVAVKKAKTMISGVPGIYSIFIDNQDGLPSPCSEVLKSRKSSLIYIGKASGSLYKRLVEQDLMHRGPSVFFRTLGAILGYRPPRGSLIGKFNTRNFKFSRRDTESIISWIEEHISVCWIQLVDENIEEIEKSLIKEHRPLLNYKNNPRKLPELAHQRKECRQIALSQD